MEQSDLLKNQIEQLGRVLQKIMSDFFGLKLNGNVEQGIEITNEHFKNQLNVDINHMISLRSKDLEKYLQIRKLNASNLEILSEYLVEIGKMKTVEVEKQSYLKKAIELLNIVDKISKTLSFQRIEKKKEIDSYL